MDQVPESREMSSQKRYYVFCRRRYFVDHPQTSNAQDYVQFDSPFSEFILNGFMYFFYSVAETRVRAGKDSALRRFEMNCCVRFKVSILDNANKALMIWGKWQIIFQNLRRPCVIVDYVLIKTTTKDLEANWDVGHIQKTSVRVPEFKKNRTGEWYIKMIHFSEAIKSEIKNGVLFLDFQ